MWREIFGCQQRCPRECSILVAQAGAGESWDMLSWKTRRALESLSSAWPLGSWPLTRGSEWMVAGTLGSKVTSLFQRGGLASRTGSWVSPGRCGCQGVSFGTEDVCASRARADLGTASPGWDPGPHVALPCRLPLRSCGHRE